MHIHKLLLFASVAVGGISGCGQDGAREDFSASPYLLDIDCNGVDIFPGQDAVSVIESQPAGTTFCFQPGIHHLSGPINAGLNDQYIGIRGAVLEGDNTVAHAILGRAGPTGHSNVTVKNLVIQHFRNDYSDPLLRNTVKTGEDWIVENNIICYNYEVGLLVGPGTVVRNNYIHHNGRYGYLIGPGLNQNVLIEGNEISYNNARNLPWATAGTGKVHGSTIGASGITWRNNWVHHNNAHGIHCDGNVGPDITIEFNRIENNGGSGIQHEASWAADIHDNIVIDNAIAYANKSCFHGAQININNSSNVNVFNNYVESTEGANGICFVDTNSDDFAPLSETVTNCTVTRNTIKLVGTASNGLVDNGDFAPYDTGDVLFDNNIYYLPHPDTGSHWVFSNIIPLTKTDWQKSGQDVNSTFLSW